MIRKCGSITAFPWILDRRSPTGGEEHENLKMYVIATFFIATILSPTAWSQDAKNTHPARPGSINYVEGQASIDTQALDPNSVGSVELREHQSLTTQDGKVEILLTPGVFLRVANKSSVRMISGDVSNVTIALDKGRAIVEVLTLHKFNTFSISGAVIPARGEYNIRINQDDGSTKLLQNGVYEFDADRNQVRVLSPALVTTRISQADVYTHGQVVRLKQGQAITLDTGGKLQARNISTRSYADDFYRWCGARSRYLSEATIDVARNYVQYGAGWYGSGWYWDRWFDVYTFVPAEGIFNSPFGWRFESPIVVYRSPFFYGDYPHRFGEFEPDGGVPD